MNGLDCSLWFTAFGVIFLFCLFLLDIRSFLSIIFILGSFISLLFPFLHSPFLLFPTSCLSTFHLLLFLRFLSFYAFFSSSPLFLTLFLPSYPHPRISHHSTASLPLLLCSSHPLLPFLFLLHHFTSSPSSSLHLTLFYSFLPSLLLPSCSFHPSSLHLSITPALPSHLAPRPPSPPNLTRQPRGPQIQLWQVPPRRWQKLWGVEA